MFELCKDTFPEEATIKCIENRLPGTIDVTIMATPCDGILECRNGIDENCDEDKWVLVTILSILLLTTIFIYLYLICKMLPKWKKTMFRNFDGNSSTQEKKISGCNEMRGNDLARIKVCFQMINILPYNIIITISF